MIIYFLVSFTTLLFGCYVSFLEAPAFAVVVDSLLIGEDTDITPQHDTRCNNHTLPSPLRILSSIRTKEKAVGVFHCACAHSLT